MLPWCSLKMDEANMAFLEEMASLAKEMASHPAGLSLLHHLSSSLLPCSTSNSSFLRLLTNPSFLVTVPFFNISPILVPATWLLFSLQKYCLCILFIFTITYNNIKYNFKVRNCWTPHHISATDFTFTFSLVHLCEYLYIFHTVNMLFKIFYLHCKHFYLWDIYIYMLLILT